MKINWGTGIVITMVAFMSFILFFVIKMSSDNRANHDLVTEEYYKQELGFQKEIDAENNGKHISLRFKETKEGLQISFPDNFDTNDIVGTMFLYKPSNKHLDFDVPIRLSNSHLLIPDKRLLDGRWDIKIFWSYNGIKYLHKKSITYKQKQ